MSERKLGVPRQQNLIIPIEKLLLKDPTEVYYETKELFMRNKRLTTVMPRISKD